MVYFHQECLLQFPLWTTCDMNTIVNLRGTLEQKGDCPQREVCLIFLKEKDQLGKPKRDLLRDQISQQDHTDKY